MKCLKERREGRQERQWRREKGIILRRQREKQEKGGEGDRISMLDKYTQEYIDNIYR